MLVGQVLAALNSTDFYPSSIAKIIEEPSRSPPLRQLRLAVRGVWCAGCGDLFAEAPASRNYSDYLHSRPSAVHPALPHAAGRSGYGYGQAKRPVLKLAGSGLQDLYSLMHIRHVGPVYMTQCGQLSMCLQDAPVCRAQWLIPSTSLAFHEGSTREARKGPGSLALDRLHP